VSAADWLDSGTAVHYVTTGCSWQTYHCPNQPYYFFTPYRFSFC